MPQISKIRIVNFNYNDGNRFIPDELYDLASPDTGKALNTLFNLNNGGGKTVLVQLMMQPVHPKAMAGGRRIEDYFSHTGDHSYILLEWNLDGSKEKLLTGISIAASSSASTEEDKRGNSVKYYTFTTHYDTFSAYSISSLELSSNDNGNYVPAQFDYVRVGKLNAIGEMIDATEIKGDRLFTISESITAMIESIRKINSKIETDLREITNDFNDLVEQCFLQGKRVYEDLRMIASSSKAHIYDGKPQIPMLKMDLPEEMELSEEASRMSIRNEIEKGANEIKEMLVNNFEEKQIQKRAKSIVGSERLLHKYIIRETVPVKVYKIDLNVANSSYKRWEDTLTQSSGAEKFVVFFSVVLTLMNYTRSTSGIVSKEAKSVLILDNPFGKITSAHLLKPMFDIAKHFNVQLICLSDINKSDVTSCFECVIKLVIKQQALSNFEIMTHEDNERIEHGYYKIMNGQMSLF